METSTVEKDGPYLVGTQQHTSGYVLKSYLCRAILFERRRQQRDGFCLVRERSSVPLHMQAGQGQESAQYGA